MTREPTRRTFVAATSVVSALAALTPTARSAPLGGDSAAFGIFREQMRQRKVPGGQIAVVHGGRIALDEAVGLASVEFGAPVTRETLFPINSATKSFTGVAVMQLVETGAVDLDAPIANWVGDIPPAWRAVRVRQLLGHTSGLPNIIGRDGLIGTKGEAEAWELVKSLPIEAAPGTRFAYNQTNYLLLGKLIDRITGKPFATFIAERQFEPTGMTRTRFADTFDVVANCAYPYSFMRRVRGADERTLSELSHWVDDMPVSLRTAGGINTTARELAAWLTALMKARLIAGPALERMWTADTLNDGTRNIYALGWPVMSSAKTRTLAGIGGARAAFFVYPDHDLAIAVLTNLVGANPESFIPDIARCYVPGL